METKDFRSKTFRSRVSVLIIIVVGAVLYRIWLIDGLTIKYVGFGTIMILAFFTQFTMHYVLNDNEIQVHYMWGLLGKPFCKFHISAITSVERSYNPFNAMAASLKRLHIRFKKGYKWDFSLFFHILPLISPVREQEFLEMLKAINPDIQINVNDKKDWWRFWDWDF